MADGLYRAADVGDKNDTSGPLHLGYRHAEVLAHHAVHAVPALFEEAYHVLAGDVLLESHPVPVLLQ
jgi:hypothetical protein